eukprot:1175138-Prymnesium_polylepis.1
MEAASGWRRCVYGGDRCAGRAHLLPRDALGRDGGEQLEQVDAALQGGVGEGAERLEGVADTLHGPRARMASEGAVRVGVEGGGEE